MSFINAMSRFSSQIGHNFFARTAPISAGPRLDTTNINFNLDHYALITGASRGIGFSLAKQLVQAGHEKLVLVSRGEDGLSQAKLALEQVNPNIDVRIVSQDLSLHEAANHLWRQLTEQDGMQFNAVINSAGFGLYGLERDMDPEQLVAMDRVNVENTLKLTRLATEHMADHNNQDTHLILNVGSVGAYVPKAFLASRYYDGKERLMLGTHEIKATAADHISMTVLNPGPTNTDFATTATLAKQGLLHWIMSDPDEVALEGLRGVFSNQDTVIPGWVWKGVAKIAPWVPAPLIKLLAGAGHFLVLDAGARMKVLRGSSTNDK